MLLVLAANAPALRFYRRHGLRVERRVDGLAHCRGMGVDWGRDGFGGQLHRQEVAKKRGVVLANLYARPRLV